MDVASLTETIAKDTRLGRLVLGGFRTEEEIAEASSEVELSLSTDTLATRGKLGEDIGGVQENMVTCFKEDLGQFVLDTAQFGIAMQDPTPLKKRSMRVAKRGIGSNPSNNIGTSPARRGLLLSDPASQLKLAAAGVCAPECDQLVKTKPSKGGS